MDEAGKVLAPAEVLPLAGRIAGRQVQPHEKPHLRPPNQALSACLLLQKQRDRAAGLNTAGFVTGYRGSPLGGSTSN